MPKKFFQKIKNFRKTKIFKLPDKIPPKIFLGSVLVFRKRLIKNKKMIKLIKNKKIKKIFSCTVNRKIIQVGFVALFIFSAFSLFPLSVKAEGYVKQIDLSSTNGNSTYGSFTLGSDGKFYGMTYAGGANNLGVIFQYDSATNTYTKKIDLSNESGIIRPYDNLTLGSDGKFYGMTYTGGANNYGVIFQYDSANNTNTKKIDLSSAIGSSPKGSLTLGPDGKFYGMTYAGGANNLGVIFQYDSATNTYTKEIDLSTTIGKSPRGSLTLGPDGKFYGMTSAGGANSVGVIFQYDSATNTYTKKVDLSATIGSSPWGSLTLGPDGKFYGRTSTGGSDNLGVIFQYDSATNTYTKKVDLSATIGSSPLGSLALGPDGKFYGTTYNGGANSVGVIFQYTPPDTIPDVFSFNDQTNKALSTLSYSNTITISGIDSPTTISISSCTGTLCKYSINGATYTANSGTVNNGDTVTVRQISSSAESTTTNLVLNIGVVTDTFSVTTLLVPPTVTAFTIPSTSNSLVLPITTFTATDNIGVTGYLITESATAPLASDAGWTANAPTTYIFTTDGTKTLYAWAKDAAGGVSTSLSALTTVDVTVPTVTAFTIPSTSNSLVLPITTFTATDNIGVTGYLITESATAPLASDAGWTANAPTTYIFTTDGTKTLYAWAKDAAGGVSTSLSASISFDITAPIITVFTVPTTNTSLTLPITNFTATDATAVTGYLITESATAPLASDAGWTANAPTTYIFTTDGTKTLYAWAKDTAGNISTSASATTIVDNVIPTLTINTVCEISGNRCTPNGANANPQQIYGLQTITGTATDNLAVSKVEISVLDTTTNKYLSSGTFSADTETYLLATGTTSWSYNFSSVPLTLSHTYNLDVKVTDTAGNINSPITTSSFVFTNSTLDVTPPVITLNGTNPMSVTLGGTYTEEGATATDAVDGTRTVSIAGTVNPNALGAYTITYTAVDATGNIGTATRTVNVVLAPSYNITATQGAHGTISPSGITAVRSGTDETYTIVPDSNYRIANLLVDGVSLVAASSYTFTNVIAEHTISANFVDNTPPKISFTTDTSSGAQSLTSVQIPIIITSAYSEDSKVDYAVTGGTATSGTDFTLTSGTATISAGQTMTTIPMTVVKSTLYAPDKTVIITLSNPVNATLGDNTVFTYTIVNDNIQVIGTAGNSIKSTSAIINWTTADFADSKVEYGTVAPGGEGAYGLSKSKDEKVLNHNIYLSNLTPLTHYYFKTSSTNLAGETTTSESDFTTTAGPIITATSNNTATDTNVTITWSTDMESSSVVYYSNDIAMTSPSRSGSDELTTSHSFNLTNLSPNTTYYFYVQSVDADNNIGEDANGGDYYSFSTGEDVTPPTILNIQVPVVAADAIAVTWVTNEPADGQVSYGTEAGQYTQNSVLNSNLSTNHLVALGDLSKNTIYYFVIKTTDADGNTTTSEERHVSTADITIINSGGGGVSGVLQSVYDSLLKDYQSLKAKIGGGENVPVLSNIVVDTVTPFGAKVSFDTDIDTICFVDYGKNTNYDFILGDKTFSKNHSIFLRGLTMGTEYHFKITAMNKTGDTTSSEDQNFKTKYLTESLDELKDIKNVEQFQSEIENTIESILPSLVPPFVSKPEVTDITENGVTISFKTNVKAYPVISYATETDYDVKKVNPYNGEVSDSNEKAINHTLGLIGLKPNTKYHIMAKAFSLPQVIGKSEDITFTTKAAKIQGSILDLKNDSFTVVWNSDEPTTSIVEYKNLKTGVSARINDEIKTATHSVKVENLTPGATYEVSVSGVNKIGNLVEGGAPVSVTTLVDTSAPIVSNLKIDSTLAPGRTDRIQTIFTWTTDEVSDSVIYYQEGSGSLDQELTNKLENSELTKNHVVILTAFKPGTVYRFQISSTDSAGNMVKPPIRTLITPRQNESIVDVIFKNFDDTFKFIKNVGQ